MITPYECAISRVMKPSTYLVLFGIVLGCTLGMLHHVPFTRISTGRRMYSSMTRFDADWQRAQLVRPHLHRLTRPLSHAIQSSSWYTDLDPSSGVPVYLREYSKYGRAMNSVRAIHLVMLPAALRSSDQEGALKKWVTEASICSTQIGLPTKLVQLLQVQYLDLLLLARKLQSEEERLAVASYIEDNLSNMATSSKREIYQLFMKGLRNSTNKKKYLDGLAMPFIREQRNFAIKESFKDIKQRLPHLDFTNFAYLWKVAVRKARLTKQGPNEQPINVVQRLFMVLAVRQPDLKQREALIKAAEMYTLLHDDIVDILLYLEENDKTINNAAVRE